ncbi:MAG: aminopeptidase P family N-terminal domain-containing protein, partial [Pseudomonadota bacterium]
MFQTFETGAAPQLAKDRIARLRAELLKRKITAYIVPRADEHQGEYVPACAERLHWLTGFSGSAGHAAITRSSAAVFVDGRYTIQAGHEVDPGIFDIEPLKPGTLSTWLVTKLKAGEQVGFDPALWTIRQVADLKSKLATHGIKLKPIAANLVDRIWGQDRPPPPIGQIKPHRLEWAGRS